MKSRQRKASRKSSRTTMSAAVAVAMGVSSGIAGANAGLSATDLNTLPVDFTAELIDEALALAAGDKGSALQSGEEYLTIARATAKKKAVKKAPAKKKAVKKKGGRAFGLNNAYQHSGKIVPPKKKVPAKK